MEVTIQNKHLRVSIRSRGAELYSLVKKETAMEYMWSGNPEFWAKTSPVLFPVVGALKNNTYQFNDHDYVLPRHGFAREAEFEVCASEETHVSFMLKSSPESLKVYPFHFQLRIEYALEGEFLSVTYVVANEGADEMFFSLGAHPAFAVPLEGGTRYEDHFLKFNRKENASRWPVSAEGLILSEPELMLYDDDTIPLSKTLFKDDALVFKALRSDIVSLRATSHRHGLDFYFEGFPYLGIWAAKNADFVCIEPWCGIADSEDHNQQLKVKEGIERLLAGESWSRSWKVRCF